MKIGLRLDNKSEPRVTEETARNWEESIRLNPSRVEYASDVDDIVRVLKNPQKYPSPVRAVGSRHSTTHCGVCDGGTLLVMRYMDQIIRIDEDAMTVTTQAGALYIDVANALRKRGLQFYVNVEIGNLTMGSAASTGTKDASMPDEFGQVCSYACGVKMVTANGSMKEITQDKPDLMQAVRSSYGLMGVIYEVTFKVKRIQAMRVSHKTYTLDEFEQALPELRKRGDSMMYYLFPFLNSLTVETRAYESSLKPGNRWVWWARNLMWKTFAPSVSHFCTKWVKNKRWRFGLIDSFYRVVQISACLFLRSKKTYSTDQIIRYPHKQGFSKYTFSIWAFPEENIMPVMRAYYAFCQDYYEQHGFRCDMLNVGYRIKHDTNPLFSYSHDGTVMTLDPVATAREEGWDDFLRAYNEICSENNGVPLFNQSKWLTRKQVKKAFGARVETFERYRTQFDPENRLLNEYFRELFGSTENFRLIEGGKRAAGF